MDDLISRQAAIDALSQYPFEKVVNCISIIEELPSAQSEPQWIPCSERLPWINQTVLLSTNTGGVHIGHRAKPCLMWQVEENGRKHWVYDPEAYTDDIDNLPKAEDISFDSEDVYGDDWLSVTSINYNGRFAGIVAWMPLPKPYEERREE